MIVNDIYHGFLDNVTNACNFRVHIELMECIKLMSKFLDPIARIKKRRHQRKWHHMYRMPAIIKTDSSVNEFLLLSKHLRIWKIARAYHLEL